VALEVRGYLGGGAVVLMLLLLVLVTGLAVAGLLYVWTAWFQGYIYSEPAEQLYWRAPAAGGALGLFLLVWVLLDYRWPGSVQVLTQFSSSDTTKPYPKLKVYDNDLGKDVVYLSKPVGGDKVEYWTAPPNSQKLKGEPEKITLLTDKDEEVGVFEKQKAETGSYTQYRDKSGRTMSAFSLGQVTTFQTWRVVATVLVNLLYGGVWFVGLWLLLRFQWTHALIQAVVAWIVTLLFVVAPLLSYAERLAAG
jgi:hypothetical protein